MSARADSPGDAPLPKAKPWFGGAIVLYFVIGFEVLIMISPAAGFFYAAFNPFLLFLNRSPATRWLTAFFLPHMVSPPDLLLQAVRVAGSGLFLAGAAMFLACAGQVYYHKFAGKGVVLRGLYSRIRHPQYLGLALTGMGLSILWPRFLVVALWALMVGVYYLLARDEQGRMLRQFGERYRSYMDRTGMFLPKAWEAAFARLLPRTAPLRAWMGFLVLTAGSLGGAFALRSYTLAHLPIWSNGPVSVLAILPGDRIMLDNRMAAALELPEIKGRLGAQGPVLAYLMPRDYVMQGMIADTGGQWQLYKRHHTLSMISDWILHPFRHLEDGHAAMHHGMGVGQGAPNGMNRRLIFLRVDAAAGQDEPAALFGINLRRSPLFMADVEMHTLAVQEIHDLPVETGWGRVPTPVF